MSSTTSAPVLPRHLDPRKFAQQSLNIDGLVDIRTLERLLPLLANQEGEISAQLQFGVDEQGIRYVTGKLNATVNVVCQRCLDAMTQSLMLPISLGIVWDDDQAANLPKTWDPWILDEGQADIYQMIEDELILGLPIVAYHETECVPQSLYEASADEALEGKNQRPKIVEETQNPFQALEVLKGALKEKPDNEG